MVGHDGPATDGDGDLVVVSNREPYTHGYTADGIEVSQPTGGLVAALDGVVAARGGTWVAWGSGDADFDPAVVDDGDAVTLPPDGDGGYRLRRLRLTREQVDRYYYGYSNQVLWPLCHLDTNYVDVQPGFWPAYETVNERFADAVTEAAGTPESPVWVQDYHLTLLPRLLRERGHDGPVGHFWHIPWPPAEVFAICPHSEAVLGGLVGADAVGFHTEEYRENFLDAATACLAADVDRKRGTVTADGRTTGTYVAPVGVDADGIATTAQEADAAQFWKRLCRRHDIDDAATVAVGVDRLDYTKGILERLDALEHLWETRPAFRDELVYVQKASRSREGIEAYRTYHARVRDRVYELNQRFGTDDWTPIVYVEDDVPRPQLLGLYRHADCCIVSSRRDGLNLVALEYVAASRGAGGTLVLSQFAGAAEMLGGGAVVVNPFDRASFADSLAAAVEMDDAEQTERFRTLAEGVDGAGIEEWIESNLVRLRRN